MRRCKSILVSGDAYLLALVRHIDWDPAGPVGLPTGRIHLER